MPPDLGPEIEKGEILSKHGELLMDFNGCLISGRIRVERGQLSRPPRSKHRGGGNTKKHEMSKEFSITVFLPAQLGKNP